MSANRLDGLFATPAQTEGMSAWLLATSQDEMSAPKSIVLSILAHLGLIVSIWLFFLIMQFLGINLFTFDRPERVKDVEFQLVTSPEAKPRNPKTKNRAEHNTRSGGQKVPRLKQMETMRQAGQPKPKPRAQASTPQARPQRTQPAQRPAPQPRPVRPVAPAPRPTQSQSTQAPAPPRPRVTAPQSSAPRQIAAVPNPVAPVKVPGASGAPSKTPGATGPIVKGPATGSGAASGSPGPVTAPGGFSGGGRPSSGGGPTGQGGRGQYSQYGSPGGGGGRPGVDAVAEPDFGPYLAELQRRIRRNWVPPEDKEDKTVVLVFTISRDGRLLSVQTKRSSGFAVADSAARAAVERSAPFRSLPPEYRHNSINVEFTFDYNVYTGRGSGFR
jgi:TonB family protein